MRRFVCVLPSKLRKDIFAGLGTYNHSQASSLYPNPAIYWTTVIQKPRWRGLMRSLRAVIQTS